MKKADLVKDNLNVITNMISVVENNISIPYTSTATSPFEVYLFNPLPFPILLHSIALNYDADNTATNYLFYIEISGVRFINNRFKQLSLNAQVYDFVPTGSKIYLDAGGIIRITAYNNNSSNTTNGNISITIVGDELS